MHRSLRVFRLPGVPILLRLRIVPGRVNLVLHAIPFPLGDQAVLIQILVVVQKPELLCLMLLLLLKGLVGW